MTAHGLLTSVTETPAMPQPTTLRRRSRLCPPLSPRPRVGFTLIELLVVIGIIAVLVGILLPVLGSARESGKAAVCLSNMRSLGQATLAYAADFDRKLPQPSTESDIQDKDGSASSAAAGRLQQAAIWFNALDFYLGSILNDGSTNDRQYAAYKQDPAWTALPDTLQTSSGPQLFADSDVRTIKMNQYFGHLPLSGVNSTAQLGKLSNKPVWFYKTTDVPDPSGTVLYGDGRGHDTLSESGIADLTSSRLFGMRPIFVGLRHGDGANLSKVDGSAGYEENPIEVTATGYRGWFDMYREATYDEADRANWPQAIFNFRPESFAKSGTEPFERRYPPKN